MKSARSCLYPYIFLWEQMLPSKPRQFLLYCPKISTHDIAHPIPLTILFSSSFEILKNSWDMTFKRTHRIQYNFSMSPLLHMYTSFLLSLEACKRRCLPKSQHDLFLSYRYQCGYRKGYRYKESFQVWKATTVSYSTYGYRSIESWIIKGEMSHKQNAKKKNVLQVNPPSQKGKQ